MSCEKMTGDEDDHVCDDEHSRILIYPLTLVMNADADADSGGDDDIHFMYCYCRVS